MIFETSQKGDIYGRIIRFVNRCCHGRRNKFTESRIIVTIKANHPNLAPFVRKISTRLSYCHKYVTGAGSMALLYYAENCTTYFMTVEEEQEGNLVLPLFKSTQLSVCAKAESRKAPRIKKQEWSVIRMVYENTNIFATSYLQKNSPQL